MVALSKERRSILSRYVIPIAGLAANIIMLGAVAWLGFIGGSDTQWAAMFAIVVTAVWMAIGLGYFAVNSRSRESGIFPFPGKERAEDKNTKYSIYGGAVESDQP
jgi:NADH:ubiquinone oxidoreductase subunit K